MTWERDPLWNKSKLFFGYAFEYSRDDPRFGLWSAMGLELLARAAIASISPTLLAEPDNEHKHLLHALGRGSEKVAKRSIVTSRVLNLCELLIDKFGPENFKSANALINRRNDELHTGTAAFEEDTTHLWRSGFYSCCNILSDSLGESLENLFGDEEAKIAKEVLTETEREVTQRVKSSIAAHKKVFESLEEDKRDTAIETAEAATNRLAFLRHHKVTCPSCDSPATVQGTAFGQENITHEDSEIVIRQAVSPNTFSCSVCNLRLNGYAELRIAGLGDQYTRTTHYTPNEYYGLVDPDDTDTIIRIAEERYQDMYEYDNE